MSELKKTDLAPDDFLKNVIPSADEIKMLREMDEVFKSIAKTAKDGIGKAQTADNKQKLADIKAEQAEQVKLEKIAQEKIRTMQRESQLRQTMNREQKQKETQDARERKAAEQLTSAYSRQSKTLNDLRKRYKDLAIEGKANTTEAKSMLKEIRSLDSQLKKVDATVGQHQRNVGNYRDTLRGATGMLQSFGLALGGVAIARNALGVIIDFDTAVTDLGAISGKTADELAPLNQQAKDLGATTAFSATQVTELQIELAKLGFTTDQIGKSTEPLLSFAAATGADLASAAALGGSALRAFGLEADQMERVVSTLGVATTKTALDFSALETGLSTVAPVAAAFGFSIEDSTALLGQLANAGFDASSAATATRNILLKMADSGGDLAQALGRPIKTADDLAAGLAELQAKGIDLAGALELTDARSVAAFQTFLGGADTLVDLRDSITDVSGELQDMADKRLDSVNGATQLLSSAWEGLILKLNEGTGVSKVLQRVIEFLANNLETIAKVVGVVGAGFLAYKTTIIATRVATSAYTAVSNLMSMAMGKNAIATKGADTAMKAFNATTKANPIGILVTLLATAVTAWFAFADGATAAEKAQNALNDAIERGNKAGQARANIYQATTDSLFKSIEEQAKAMELAGKSEQEINEFVTKEKQKQTKVAIDLIEQEINKEREGADERNKIREEELRRLNMYQEYRGEQVYDENRIKQLRRELTEGVKIDEQRTDAYTKQLEIQLNELKSKLNETLIEEKRAQKEITEEQKKGFVDRQKELDILRRRAEDIEDSLIEDDFERKEQKLWRQFEREMEAIKGNSEIENRLRKDLQMQLDAELLNLEKERNRKRQEEAVKFAEWWEKFTQDIDNKEAKMRDEEFNAEIEAREKQSKRVQLETLKNTELTADEVARLEKERLVELLEEKIKIYKAYGKDTLDLEIELQNAQNDLNQKELKSEEDHAEALKVVADALTDYWQKQFDKRLELIDKEQAAAQKQADFYRELAAQGNIDANQSILEAQRIAEQAERERQRVEQQKARLQLITSGLSTYQSKVAAGDPNPLASTITEVTLLSNFLSTLPAFFEGIEDTGKGGGLDGKGGFLSVLHPNERVMPAKDNKKVTGLSNTELADVGYKYRTGQLIDIHKTDTAGNSFDILPLLKKQDELIKALKDKNEIDYRIDEVVSNAFSIIKTQKKGKEVVTTKTRLRS
jgi:TP901 family phage tail tape measure protein